MSSDDADDDEVDDRLVEDEGDGRGDQLVDSVRSDRRLLIRGECSFGGTADGSSVSARSGARRRDGQQHLRLAFCLLSTHSHCSMVLKVVRDVNTNNTRL